MTTSRGDLRTAPGADAGPDGRSETPSERADRNWDDVLQELRVLQTGTQILTGFLLAVAFQPAFGDLTDPQRAFYLGLLVLAALSAIIALAPVAMHRSLFRRLCRAATRPGSRTNQSPAAAANGRRLWTTAPRSRWAHRAAGGIHLAGDLPRR